MLRRAFSTSRRRFLDVTHESTLTGTRHRLEFVCEPRRQTDGDGAFILYGLFFKREEAFLRVHARLLREQRTATLNSIAQELLNKTSEIPRDTLMDLARAIERDGAREFE